jgi:hypothetical protein
MSYISKVNGTWILSQLSWSVCLTFQRSMESGSFINYHPEGHILPFKGHWNLDPLSTIILEHMSYISKVIGIWILHQLSPWSTCLIFQRSLESGSFINYHPEAHILHFKGHWNLDPSSTITLEHMSYISKVIGIWILHQLSWTYVLHFKGHWNLDPLSTITLKHISFF